MLAITEGTSIYYIYPGKSKLFHPKLVQNVVIAIKIQMNSCFPVAKNLVPVEDILEINNFDDTLNEAARYNARIWGHYI